MLNFQLAVILDSSFFRICGAIIGLLLTVLWGGIATRTTHLTINGSMFHAPCLDDAPLNVGAPLPETGELLSC
jgi:hypothetical protein